MSLLEQDIIIKKRAKKVLKLNTGNNSKEYKIDAIWDNAVYAKKWEGYLSGLYYLVPYKSYLKEKNT